MDKIHFKIPKNLIFTVVLIISSVIITIPNAWADTNTASISGVVTSPEGSPLQGVYVKIMTTDYENISGVTSDVNGQYSFTGLSSGSYYITFYPSSSNSNYAVMRYSNNQSNIWSEITLSDGQSTSNINAQLQYAGNIAGRVYDPNGQPISGIVVQAQDEVGSFSINYTNSNGEYNINQLPTGYYKLVFDTAAYNAQYGTDYLTQWYNNQTSYNSGDQVVVLENQTSNADAHLQTAAGTVTGIKAEACGNQITINWSVFPGAQSYNIYRATWNRATYENIGNSTSTSYTDSNLSLSTDYWYKVTPVTATGEGSFSAPVSTKTKSSASTDPLDNWNARRQYGSGDELVGITYSHNTFVAVGANGCVQTSDNALNWIKRDAGTSNALYGVTYGNGIFVAVGANGTIISSANGITWTLRQSGKTNKLTGVTYGNNTFIAVGERGTILSSPDGTTWTIRKSEGSSLYGVNFGSNTFVAVGINTILTSKDGVNWTSNFSGSANLQGVCYGNNTFVAVGYGGKILSSSDMITWTDRSQDSSNYLRRVAYGNNTFIAVAYGNTIYTSADGVNWTLRSSGYSYTLRDVINANNTFLAVGSGGMIIQSGKLVSSLCIMTDKLDGGTMGVSYQLSLRASGGTLPYTWSATGLPGGLGIDPSTGLTSGTPTNAGAFQVNVTVTDSSGNSSNKGFSLIVNDSIGGVSLNKSSIALRPQQTAQLNAIILPAGSVNSGITWSVESQSANDVVTLSSAGLVTGIKEGTAVIRATSIADVSKFAECSIRVIPVITTTIAGKGEAGFSGDGGPATAALLDAPSGIAFDHAGNLYITGHNQCPRIRRVDNSGIITTAAGTGRQGYSGDGGPMSDATLRDPNGVAFDADGNMYIADGERIRQVDITGTITTIAGMGAAGDGGPAFCAKLYAKAIALDNDGNIYIADGNKIRKVDTSGIISTIAGTDAEGYSGDGGPAVSATLAQPSGLAIDHNGNLYIADRFNHRIRKVDTGGVITTIAGTGSSGYSGDGGAAVAAQLSYPCGVVLDNCENLYIVDTNNDRIRKVDSSGIITTTAGSSEGMFLPQGAAFDVHGNLYIADTGGNYIRKVALATSTISPANCSFDKKPDRQKDITTVITLNGDVLESVTNETETLSPGTDYILNADAVTINKEYLAARSPGKTRLIFNFGAGCSQVLAIAVTDTTNGINVDANRSICSISQRLRPGGTSTVTAILKDTQGNLIRKESIKITIAVTIKNVNATNSEIYSVGGQVCTETTVLTKTLTSNEQGQISFNVLLPVKIDNDDGISLQVKTSAGTGIGRSFSYPEKWDLELSYGISDNFSLVPASDGGFFIMGSGNNSYPSLLKVDSYGNHLWEKDMPQPVLIIPTSSGGCMVAADVWGSGCNYRTVYAAAYDTKGQLIWENTVLSYQSITINKVLSCSDGGFVLAGYLDIGTDHLVWRGFVLKLDSQGKKQWDKILGDDDDYHCSDIIEARNGFRVLLQRSIISLDIQGNITSDYPITDYQISSLLKFSDSELKALGPGNSFGFSGTALVSINEGTVAYANKIIVGFTATSAECLDNGGYILFGKTDSGNPVMAVVDPAGNLVFQKDNCAESEIKGATKLTNGEYLIVSFDSQSLKYYAEILPSALQLTDINPPENKVLVSVRSQVTAAFSGLINPNSVNANTFKVRDDQGNQVDGIINVSKNRIIFKPLAYLKYSQLYIIEISTGIVDICGKHLSADYQGSFTTESAEVSYTTSVWPVAYRRDPQRTSLSPYRGPESIHLQKIIPNYGYWYEGRYDSYPHFYDGLMSMIIGQNKKTIVVSGIHTRQGNNWYDPSIKTHNTTAFTTDGRQAWSVASSGQNDWYYTSAIEGKDRSIFVGPDKNVRKLNIDDGSFKGTTNYFPELIGPDGTSFVYRGGGLIEAIGSDDTLKWKFTNGSIPIAVGCDGALYTSCYDNHNLICLNPDGTERFQVPIGGPLLVSLDNIVYGSKVENGSCILYAVDHNGEIQWGINSCSPVHCCLGPDGSIYISDNMWIKAISSDGRLEWEKQISSVITTPTVDANGLIYFFSYSDQCFNVLDKDGNELSKTAPQGITIRPDLKNQLVLDNSGHIWAFVKYSTGAGYDYGIAIFGEADYGPITGFEGNKNIANRDPGKVNNKSKVSDPVDTATGAHLLERELISCHGAQDLKFNVEYNSLLINDGSLGRGWGHNYETCLEVSTDETIKVHWTSNRWNLFQKSGSNQYLSSDGATQYDKLIKNPDNSYTLTRNDQSVYEFNDQGRLLTIKNKNNQAINLGYNSSGQLSAITEPISGLNLSLQYNTSGCIEKVTDCLNQQVSFTYDNDKNLTGIISADGNTVAYTYNSLGQVLSAVDSLSQQIFLNTYDEKGRIATQDDGIYGNQLASFSYDETSQNGKSITTYTDREGHNQVFVHDSNFNLLSFTDGNGNTISYRYDRFGNRINEIDPNGNTTKFTYDDRGNMLSCTDAAGNVTTMTYDACNNQLTVTRPDGKSIAMTYDDKNNLLSQTDEGGNITTYTYDDNSLMLSKTVPGQGTTNYTYENGLLKTAADPEGVVTVYSYDAAGRVASITDRAGNATTMTYDALGNPLTITDPLGHTITYTYDCRGNLLTQTDANGNMTTFVYNGNGKITSQTNALGYVTIYEYDGEDRLIRITDPLGYSNSYSYDAGGRLINATNALGQTLTTTYDANGNIISVTDASGNTIKTNSYDNLNQLISMADALGNTSTIQYDLLGKISMITDPKERNTTLAYDANNRLVSVTDPMSGLSLQSFNAAGNRVSLTDPNGNRQTFNYNASGRISRWQNALGNCLTYVYNNRGLLNQLTNGRGQTSSYSYDETGKLTGINNQEESLTCSYDNNGNLLTISNNGSTITKTYDALNRMTSCQDACGNTISYQYDEAGNLVKLSYPDGKEVNYQYDAVNRMTKVTDWAGRETDYEYDLNGQLTKTTRPDGSILNLTYDAAGQITQQKDIDKEGNIIAQYDFTYDQVGNILTEESIAPLTATLNNESITMNYDSDNRLVSFNDKALTYDDDGNLTSGPLQDDIINYTYDSQNRLIQAGNTTYSYDAQNNRIQVKTGEEETNYITNSQPKLSQVLVKELDGVKTCYVYGIGLIGEETGSEYITYHYDRRGSTVALTDSDGKITDSYSYDPFGKMLDHTGSSTTGFLYNGRDGVIDDGNGLYYMRARYYSPQIKRFINQDVLEGSINNGQSLNRYAYVNGQPVNMVDPFGLSPRESNITDFASDILQKALEEDKPRLSKAIGYMDEVNLASSMSNMNPYQIIEQEAVNLYNKTPTAFINKLFGMGDECEEAIRVAVGLRIKDPEILERQKREEREARKRAISRKFGIDEENIEILQDNTVVVTIKFRY